MTFIEALDNLMPGFDREVAKLAQRLLIQGRPIDYHTGVIATKVTPGERGARGRPASCRAAVWAAVGAEAQAGAAPEVLLARPLAPLGRVALLTPLDPPRALPAPPRPWPNDRARRRAGREACGD